MATGLGIDAVTDGSGNVSGTSAQDVRRIWGGIYSPGILSGCNVTTSATDMTYTVKAGVAAIQTATDPRQVVLVPVPGIAVTANPVGATSRTDRIYVQQQIPGSTNDVVVGVAQGTSIPANSQLLATFTASANSTTTSTSYFTGSMPYSVPYGANLGVFYAKTDTNNSAITKGTAVTIGTGTFTLMTDRKCIFMADTTVSALRPDGSRAVYFDNSAYTELTIEAWIDGVKEFAWNTPGLHQAWATYHFEKNVNLLSGEHTVTYKYYYGTNHGPGTVMRHFSGTNSNTGTTVSVRDGGFWGEVGSA